MKLNFKLILLFLIASVAIVLLVFAPVKQWLLTALTWVQGLGIWGPVFVVSFYMIACVFFLPGSILTLATGFIFKVVIGTITVSIGATLGACAAFWVGRTIARDWISRKVAKNEKFTAIDNAVGRQGFKIVLLTRLSPIFPFNLLNYAFGLTQVSFWQYALASWLGMLPGTVMYVYLGAGLRSLTDVAAGKVEIGMAGRIFFWFGMAVAIAVTLLITQIARRALKQAVEQPTGMKP